MTTLEKLKMDEDEARKTEKRTPLTPEQKKKLMDKFESGGMEKTK